jgi:uncharacterized integral membrane protein (TIGR00698 family)
MLPKLAFAAGLLLAIAPFSSPPLALALGIAFGLTLPHPFALQSREWSKWMLQGSVVALGFGMDLAQVLRAGQSGFVYTLIGLLFTLALGMFLARLMRVPSRTAYLISTGTAICGGSAIAAVAPVIEARDEEISVSIGTVFLLNAAGLLIFPWLGRALNLTEAQFGLWAALAIHDTSSVVGAGATYGAVALAIATAVKLARALWIVPLTLATAAWLRRVRPRTSIIQWPWFIGLFLLAAMANTYFAEGRSFFATLFDAGKVGLAATLFLIGTGFSRDNLRRVGVRPLALGIVLWFLVAAGSWMAIWKGWIAVG